MCLFRSTNLEEINEKFSRQTGNEIITNVSQVVKQNLAKQYVFVRYMGPKFAIVFSGIDAESVIGFLKEIKEKVEAIEVEFVQGEEPLEEYAKPKLNMVVSTYYKGTALEGLTKKLEEYLDNAPKSENTINYL